MEKISLEKLTTEEKIHFAAGNTFWSFGGCERLSLPAVKVSDASNGLREQYKDEGYASAMGNIPALCYPSLCACGCSFDLEMMFETGRAIGEECRARGISVLLGPGINIERNPLCGRNFEYFSEDPLLSGMMGAAFIRGVQSTGVAACPKHFAANNQETRRSKSDSVVDVQTLFELYLRSFEIAVREGKPWTIMGAYNKLNGTYCCENRWLLDDILRKTWGFDGLVLSDWGGMNDAARSFNAGLDVEMPGGVNKDELFLMELLQSGALKQRALDRAAENVLKLTARTEQARSGDFSFDKSAHLRTARRMAESSFVLLKNEGTALPLAKTEKILVVGAFAKRPRYQGAGSSKVKMSRAETPWMYLKKEFTNISYEEGYHPEPERNEKYFRQAVLAAEQADKVLFFAGLPENAESEGFDRADMKLPAEQNRLIRALVRGGAHVTVILQTGSAVELLWQNDVDAILLCYLGGSALGSALLNVLTGKANPSGRLAESWPVRLSDVPSYEIYPSREEKAVYREKADVGYRYFNRSQKAAAYPFGWGLSYSSFTYRELSAAFRKEKILVSVTVKNTGQYDGREVVQIYLAEEGHPEQRILGAFAKVFLKAGEEKTVSLEIEPAYVSSYCADAGEMRFAAGRYLVFAGSSSRDMILSAALAVPETLVYPIQNAEGGVGEETEEDADRISMNTSLRDLEKYRVMRPVIKVVRAAGSRSSGHIVTSEKMPDLMLDAPFRQITTGTNGRVTAEQIRKACAFFDNLVQKHNLRKKRKQK